jgi:hypothetical protein
LTKWVADHDAVDPAARDFRAARQLRERGHDAGRDI